MKQRISIFISLLAVCLLLSTLMACAPATPPIDDTPVPTPDTTEPDIDTPIDSSVPEQNVTPTPDQPDEPDAPDEPTIPDEPITPQEPDAPDAPQPILLEDYQLPYATEGARFEFLSFEHMLSFMEAIPYLAEDSVAYQILDALDFPRRMTYYLPNPDAIPEGYAFVYGWISDVNILLQYSSTPELYLDNYKQPDGSPWKWPKETTLTYTIYDAKLEERGKIRMNDDTVDAAQYVTPYHVGTNPQLVKEFRIPTQVDGQFHFFSQEEWSTFIQQVAYVPKYSDAYAILGQVRAQDTGAFYRIDPNAVPKGYELIYIQLTRDCVIYNYSRTPKEYAETPYRPFPKESSLVYVIFPDLFEVSGKIYLNDEIIDGSNMVYKQFAGEDEPFAPTVKDVPLLPCIDDTIYFSSQEQMTQQLRAIHALSPSDADYNTYAALRPQELTHYYALRLTIDSPRALAAAWIDPDAIYCKYHYVSTPSAFAEYRISRVPSDDPLAEIEQQYSIPRRDGMVVIPDACMAYFVLDDVYLASVRVEGISHHTPENQLWLVRDYVQSLFRIPLNTDHLSK
jgi:hypothetical protein